MGSQNTNVAETGSQNTNVREVYKYRVEEDEKRTLQHHAPQVGLENPSSKRADDIAKERPTDDKQEDEKEDDQGLD